MDDPVISLRELTKSYGRFHALSGVTFDIPRGTIFGFLGANGAGKTTTIRMLCGLSRPTSGSATLLGKDVWRQRHAVRQSFGYVAQRFSLYRDLTVSENLRFFGGSYRMPRRRIEERVEELLALTDLQEKADATAASLSGGMRQLLAVGCALIHDPPILFLDEPTAGLDPVHRQQMWNLLYDLSSAGITIFVTTHYMDEAERCTEVGFLAHGKLLAQAPPRELIGTFRTRVLELEVEPAMRALIELRKAPGVLGVSLRSGRIRIYSAEPEALISRWHESWPYPELKLTSDHWSEPDMEDVFTAYSQSYDGVLKERK